jgi:hypothetical protein
MADSKESDAKTPAPGHAPTAAVDGHSASPPSTEAPQTEILPATHWAQLPLEDEPAHGDGASADDEDSAFGDVASSTASLSESIMEYRNIHGRTFHSNVGVAESW